MKVATLLGAIVVARLLFLHAAVAQAAPGSSTGPETITGHPEHVTLVGYVRQGQVREADAANPIPYLYLELKAPIGEYVHNLKPSEQGYRDIELVGGSSRIIYRLEALVGKKVTVRGELPFRFDANAPKVVLPLVMLMDASNPQLFK